MSRHECMCGALDCPSCGPAQGYVLAPQIDETELTRRVEEAVADQFTGQSTEHENYIADLFCSEPVPRDFKSQCYGRDTLFQALLHAVEERNTGTAMTILHMLHGRIYDKLTAYIEPSIRDDMQDAAAEHWEE